jgi:hypothetical protein
MGDTISQDLQVTMTKILTTTTTMEMKRMVVTMKQSQKAIELVCCCRYCGCRCCYWMDKNQMVSYYS